MSRVGERLQALVRAYRAREELDVGRDSALPEQALVRFLLLYLMPLWTAVGLLDWYWHKQTDIEHTSGTTESLIHLLMFAEVGAPIMMGLFLEIDAGVLAAMAAALGLHEATAFWDVAYAVRHREVRPREQHTHSFLEVLPFMALSMASCLHWDQARALVGRGSGTPDFRIRFKGRKLPRRNLIAIGAMIAGGVALPYGNELWRCLRARRQR